MQDYSRVSQTIQPGINDLPNNLLQDIFSYLELVELCRAALVCKRWTNSINQPSLWNRISFDDQVESREVKLEYVNDTQENYFRRFFSSSRCWERLYIVNNSVPHYKLPHINKFCAKYSRYFIMENEVDKLKLANSLSFSIFKIPSLLGIYFLFMFFLFMQLRLNSIEFSWWIVFLPLIITNCILIFQMISTFYLEIRHSVLSTYITGLHQYITGIFEYVRLSPFYISFPILNLIWIIMMPYNLSLNINDRLSWYKIMIPHWIMMFFALIGIIAMIIATVQAVSKTTGLFGGIPIVLTFFLILATDVLICMKVEDYNNWNWWLIMMPMMIVLFISFIVSFILIFKIPKLLFKMWLVLTSSALFSILWVIIMVGVELEGKSEIGITIMFIPIMLSILWSPVPVIAFMLQKITCSSSDLKFLIKLPNIPYA